SSTKLSTSGAGATTNVGWIRVSPSPDSKTPTVVGVFSFRNGEVTTTEAGVSGIQPGVSFRLYAESSANTSSTRSMETGVAIANTGATPVTVNLELLNLSGSTTGSRGALYIPGQGQVALFLNQIPGLASQ